MLEIRIHDDRIEIGERFAVSFQRTLRLPDDGRVYPLPPTLGKFPILSVEAYASRLPPAWRVRGGVFIPMYQSEAMWLAFEGMDWKPNAVKVGLGEINALTGESWRDGLHDGPQDYLVCPQQPWLDGIYTEAGVVRQFVAMPLGEGYTVEAQLTGEEAVGGLQVQVFEPRAGIFPDTPPQPPPMPDFSPQEALFFQAYPAPQATPAMDMGVGAGGQMHQKIYPDSFGLDVWDQDQSGFVHIHILNSQQFHQVTGELLPPTPVDAAAYTQAGLPWFELYDEGMPGLVPGDKFAGIKSVTELKKSRGESIEETSLEIDSQQVRRIKRRRRNHAQDEDA